MTPVFDAEVAAGKLTMRNADAFRAYLSTLDGPVRVTVGKRRKSRSDSQNRYYFGVVLKLMSEATGHTQLELHEAMKSRFNCGIVTVGKQIIVVPHTTTTLNTMEFTEFIERVRQFAAQELDLRIPDPNETDI